MSKTIAINSSKQFKDVLSSSKIVVTDFWADWCGPCKQIAPLYEQLSAQLSRPGKVTFTKVDVEANKDIAKEHGITAMPTFMIFESGSVVQSVRGADPRALRDLIHRVAQEIEADGPSTGSASASTSTSSSSTSWLGASLPRGYVNATDQIDVRGLEILNASDETGDVRSLFATDRPRGFAGKKDWVESDTDEQLMLYMPFQSSLKVRALHLTSLIPKGDDEDEDEKPMKPKTIKLYTNRSTNMGFDEAESVTATQEFVLEEKDWDAKTNTAKLELRYVKFQNVTSLVVFVVDGDGDGEKTRIDRIRVVGEVGEKRDQGKLEKVGEE